MTSARLSWDEKKVTGGKLKGSVHILTQMWSPPSGKTSYLEKYMSEWKSAKTNSLFLLMTDREISTVA